jgi:hypothetical protein
VGSHPRIIKTHSGVVQLLWSCECSPPELWMLTLATRLSHFDAMEQASRVNLGDLSRPPGSVSFQAHWWDVFKEGFHNSTESCHCSMVILWSMNASIASLQVSIVRLKGSRTIFAKPPCLNLGLTMFHNGKMCRSAYLAVTNTVFRQKTLVFFIKQDTKVPDSSLQYIWIALYKRIDYRLAFCMGVAIHPWNTIYRLCWNWLQSPPTRG